MKILYHHRTVSRDGQAVHIEELIRAFRVQGHEVRVVAPSVDSPSATLGDRTGWVQRLRTRLPKPVYECLELGYSVVAYRRLAREARDFEPDFIYERYNLFLLSGLMLSRRRRIPLLLEVNSPLAEEREQFGGLALPRLAAWAEGVVWRGADVVLPVTHVLRTHVAARGAAVHRIAVVPNGINLSQFGSAPDTPTAKAALGWERELVLGFTGFVREWHGVDRILRWMASSDAPAEARLLIVGDGPAREPLEGLASELALGDRVRFTGIVSREEVPRYVAAFDVALQPAVVPYASPLKLFEYLALGKAIVAPRQPNIEEVLEHGHNALLFDPKESGSIERSLSRLCRDGELRQRIGAAAIATIALRNLTWEGNAQRVIALAAPLCAEPSTRLSSPIPKAEP
jgi:glycosyltransferase involved in cell wall biosynthesis